MKTILYIIKLLISAICLVSDGEIYANEGNDKYIMNTNLVNASIVLTKPVSVSNCTMEITVTGITERTLFINKAQDAISMNIDLVDSYGKSCPLTEKGEMYYGEKAKKRYSVSGVLIWLKKDQPISNKMDLAEFFQLKPGHWILKISLPLSEIREEGKRSGGGGCSLRILKLKSLSLKNDDESSLYYQTAGRLFLHGICHSIACQ